MLESIGALAAVLDFSAEQLNVPRPLQVHEDEWVSPTPEAARKAQLVVEPVPALWATRIEHVPSGPNNLAHDRIQVPSLDEVAEWLRPYPSLSGLGRPSRVASPQPKHDAQEPAHRIRVAWDDRSTADDMNLHEWTMQRLDVDSGDTHRAFGLVLPAIGGNDRAQHPLMTWWIVLYSLSMLARYFPNEWTDLLDVDRSQLAVPLEHLIDAASRYVPHLVLETISGLAH
jgi:hypothetical protein